MWKVYFGNNYLTGCVRIWKMGGDIVTTCYLDGPLTLSCWIDWNHWKELGTTLQDAQMRDQEVHLVAILGTIVWTQTYEWTSNVIFWWGHDHKCWNKQNLQLFEQMSNGSSHFSPSSFPMSFLFLYILLRVLDVVNTLHVLKRLRKNIDIQQI